MTSKPTIAVLVPCYNEEAAIAAVVRDFKRALPDANIYVYDNASTDRTSCVADVAGAIVRYESLKGKGNVVRRMFADVEADDVEREHVRAVRLERRRHDERV